MTLVTAQIVSYCEQQRQPGWVFSSWATRVVASGETLSSASSEGLTAIADSDGPIHVLGNATFDAHHKDPNTVLISVAGLGESMPRTIVVGCQPASLDDGIGVSGATCDHTPSTPPGVC